jgi:superfamily II DNA/RNA helicase
VAKAFFTGIVSYFPGAGSEYVPTVKIMDPVKVVMSPEQASYYFERDSIEQKLMIKPNESLLKKDPKEYYKRMRLYIMARKRTLTRSASNFLQLFPGKPDLPEEEGGWLTEDLFSRGQLLTYSRKFVALFLNIIYNFNQKHVVFTFFKRKGGANLIKYLLERCGINVLLFSGDQTDVERVDALRKFNDPDNRYGEKYKVLVVTEAGAEGISVLEARHMHILESSPRVYKTIQAIGRVARFKSHSRLPPEEREIKVWRYWSIIDPGKPTEVKYTVTGEDGEAVKKQKIEPGTELVDEQLYKEGEKNIVKIKSFLNILKANSVL